ncbi:hypothetical protein DERP_009465 [Dermatophagoides pteronyssinus]|uniref:EGF-like domain-containing protein n=1 Tax=Dermatophagoides pteronyssinus TaxID=6956 RepID=A0ABQ8IU85_DERPT|nr:hypothetical protein DERP_009465 [Dermatophagoides pteronyssinus]
MIDDSWLSDENQESIDPSSMLISSSLPDLIVEPIFTTSTKVTPELCSHSSSSSSLSDKSIIDHQTGIISSTIETITDFDRQHLIYLTKELIGTYIGGIYAHLAKTRSETITTTLPPPPTTPTPTLQTAILSGSLDLFPSINASVITSSSSTIPTPAKNESITSFESDNLHESMNDIISSPTPTVFSLNISTSTSSSSSYLSNSVDIDDDDDDNGKQSTIVDLWPSLSGLSSISYATETINETLLIIHTTEFYTTQINGFTAHYSRETSNLIAGFGQRVGASNEPNSNWSNTRPAVVANGGGRRRTTNTLPVAATTSATRSSEFFHYNDPTRFVAATDDRIRLNSQDQRQHSTSNHGRSLNRNRSLNRGHRGYPTTTTTTTTTASPRNINLLPNQRLRLNRKYSRNRLPHQQQQQKQHSSQSFQRSSSSKSNGDSMMDQPRKFTRGNYRSRFIQPSINSQPSTVLTSTVYATETIPKIPITITSIATIVKTVPIFHGFRTSLATLTTTSLSTSVIPNTSYETIVDSDNDSITRTLFTRITDQFEPYKITDILVTTSALQEIKLVPIKFGYSTRTETLTNVKTFTMLTTLVSTDSLLIPPPPASTLLSPNLPSGSTISTTTFVTEHTLSSTTSVSLLLHGKTLISTLTFTSVAPTTITKTLTVPIQNDIVDSSLVTTMLTLSIRGDNGDLTELVTAITVSLQPSHHIIQPTIMATKVERDIRSTTDYSRFDNQDDNQNDERMFDDDQDQDLGLGSILLESFSSSSTGQQTKSPIRSYRSPSLSSNNRKNPNPFISASFMTVDSPRLPTKLRNDQTTKIHDSHPNNFITTIFKGPNTEIYETNAFDADSEQPSQSQSQSGTTFQKRKLLQYNDNIYKELSSNGAASNSFPSERTKPNQRKFQRVRIKSKSATGSSSDSSSSRLAEFNRLVGIQSENQTPSLSPSQNFGPESFNSFRRQPLVNHQFDQPFNLYSSVVLQSIPSISSTASYLLANNFQKPTYRKIKPQQHHHHQQNNRHRIVSIRYHHHQLQILMIASSAVPSFIEIPNQFNPHHQQQHHHYPRLPSSPPLPIQTDPRHVIQHINRGILPNKNRNNNPVQIYNEDLYKVIQKTYNKQVSFRQWQPPTTTSYHPIFVTNHLDMPNETPVIQPSSSSSNDEFDLSRTTSQINGDQSTEYPAMNTPLLSSILEPSYQPVENTVTAVQPTPNIDSTLFFHHHHHRHDHQSVVRKPYNPRYTINNNPIMSSRNRLRMRISSRTSHLPVVESSTSTTISDMASPLPFDDSSSSSTIEEIPSSSINVVQHRPNLFRSKVIFRPRPGQTVGQQLNSKMMRISSRLVRPGATTSSDSSYMEISSPTPTLITSTLQTSSNYESNGGNDKMDHSDAARANKFVRVSNGVTLIISSRVPTPTRPYTFEPTLVTGAAVLMKNILPEQQESSNESIQPSMTTETVEYLRTSTLLSTMTYFATLFNGSTSSITPIEDVKTEFITFPDTTTVTRPVDSSSYHLDSSITSMPNQILFHPTDYITSAPRLPSSSSTVSSAYRPSYLTSLKSTYTTLTHYITLFHGSHTVLSSIEEISPTIVTETFGQQQTKPSHHSDGQVSSSINVDHHHHHMPNIRYTQPAIDKSKNLFAGLMPSVSTLFTTHTYYTTLFSGTTSIIQSREEITHSLITMYVPSSQINQQMATSTSSIPMTTTESPNSFNNNNNNNYDDFWQSIAGGSNEQTPPLSTTTTSYSDYVPEDLDGEILVGSGSIQLEPSVIDTISTLKDTSDAVVYFTNFILPTNVIESENTIDGAKGPLLNHGDLTLIGDHQQHNHQQHKPSTNMAVVPSPPSIPTDLIQTQSPAIKPGAIIELTDLLDGANLAGNIGEAIKDIVQILAKGQKNKMTNHHHSTPVLDNNNNNAAAFDIDRTSVVKNLIMPPKDGATVSHYMDDPVYIPINQPPYPNDQDLSPSPTMILPSSSIFDRTSSVYFMENMPPVVYVPVELPNESSSSSSSINIEATLPKLSIDDGRMITSSILVQPSFTIPSSSSSATVRETYLKSPIFSTAASSSSIPAKSSNEIRTKYVTNVESTPSIVVMTTTKVYYTRDSPLTITSSYTSTMPLRTVITTIVGSSTILNTYSTEIRPTKSTQQFISQHGSTAATGDSNRIRMQNGGTTSSTSSSSNGGEQQRTPFRPTRRPGGINRFKPPSRATEPPKIFKTSHRPRQPYKPSPTPPPDFDIDQQRSGGSATKKTTIFSYPKTTTRPSILDLDQCKPGCNAANKEICKEFDGKFKCDCRAGYIKKPTGSDVCLELQNFIVLVRVTRLGDQELEWNSILSNHTSDLYQNLAQAARNQIDSAYIMISSMKENYIGTDVLDINKAQDGHARCINEPGSYRCECLNGYPDLDLSFPGRMCASEIKACEFCYGRGDCYRDDTGQISSCKCHRMYLGRRCEINVLAIFIPIIAILSIITICSIVYCCRKWRNRALVKGFRNFSAYGPNMIGSTLDRKAMLETSSDNSDPLRSHISYDGPAAITTADATLPREYRRRRESEHPHSHTHHHHDHHPYVGSDMMVGGGGGQSYPNINNTSSIVPYNFSTQFMIPRDSKHHMYNLYCNS